MTLRLTKEQALEVFEAPKPGRSKYGAKRVEAWGVKFDSKTECKRYGELRTLERMGEISDLRPHPVFELHAGNGAVVGPYTADSEYFERGAHIVEDVKSEGTATEREYKWKRRHFEAEYPHITFREVVR